MSKSFFFTAFALNLATTPFHVQAEITPNTEIAHIEEEIETLQSQLKNLRKDAFNQEMDAQAYMFDNWSDYVGKINANEKDEQSIIQLKDKIEKLKQRKQELLKDSHKP